MENQTIDNFYKHVKANGNVIPVKKSKTNTKKRKLHTIKKLYCMGDLH